MTDTLNMPTGAKYDGGKLRYDLIPARPLEELARVYTIGAQKYADRNWEKGIAWCRIFGAMMRHAWRWFRGEKWDRETGQHHLSSVAWCAFALIEYEHTHTELDDRPVLDLAESTAVAAVGSGGLVTPVNPGPRALLSPPVESSSAEVV